MKFKYTARTQKGELQTGFVEAVTRDVALNVLLGHDLYILSIEGAEKIGSFDKFLNIFKKVRLSDLMIFTRQFATLMEAKVPLGDSLRNLYKQTKNPTLKEVIFELSSDIDSGLSLSQALERQGTVFSEFYVSMIRSSEITGRLEESMKFLADYLDKETIRNTRIKNALIYPIFIIILFIIVAGIMVAFVFPQIQPIFQESNIDLPFITKALLSSGSFILNWWWSIIIVVGLFVALLINYFKSPEGKTVFNELIIKIPVFGNLSRKIYIARFAESTSVLIKGGIPVAQSLEISSHAIGNVVYRDILHEVAEGVRAGSLLSDLLNQNEYYFPALVGQMVAVGESTGQLDNLLGRISNFYSREVDDTLSSLVELIQPALIVVIGVFVGLLFAAILIPLYNLTQSF